MPLDLSYKSDSALFYASYWEYYDSIRYCKYFFKNLKIITKLLALLFIVLAWGKMIIVLI